MKYQRIGTLLTLGRPKIKQRTPGLSDLLICAELARVLKTQSHHEPLTLGCQGQGSTKIM